MVKNADLVGRVYRNGAKGARFVVVRICRQDPDFVFAEQVNCRAYATTALAAFVRDWLEKEETP